MEVFIVTGASKGIGYELAKQLSSKGHFVIGVARSEVNIEDVYFIECDLSKTESIEHKFEQIVELIPENPTKYTLVNNAGMIEPIGLAGDLEGEMIANSIAVNLTAPILLSNLFINKLKDVEAEKRIVNISSGAGRKPYEGWSSYCTTKAGLDHFTRVAALEQKNAKYPVQIVSIAPGIIDTGMQEKIRSSKEEDFPLVDRFRTYKENEDLSSPAETASKLISFMNEMEKYEGPILDIRNM